MFMKIRKCERCKRYTLREKCRCGLITVSPHPPKFSPEDRWGEWRRKAKKLVENRTIR
ncbi:MAG: RNA-protein complex protein Nop10 [Candidatus Micrarchaeota archaeon]|nr:RNA-protein complex protein Nop10 [Candidatus Micrarchaeota archaeon]